MGAQLMVAVNVVARMRFAPAIFGKGLGMGDHAGNFYSFDHHIGVMGVGIVVGKDARRIERIGRAQLNASHALWTDQRWPRGKAVSFNWRETVVDEKCGAKMVLNIRC